MLSWWFLLPCLLVSGLAAYLLVEGTRAGDYPWAHYPLTVALAPILLIGVYAGAIFLSGAVFDFLETPQPASHSPSTVPVTNENTRPESTLEDTQAPKTTLATIPEDVAGSSSPSASSSASPSAAPTASSTATPSASPTAPSTASSSPAPSSSPAATAGASSASPSP